QANIEASGVVLHCPVFHLRSFAKYAAADLKKSRSCRSTSFSRRNLSNSSRSALICERVVPACSALRCSSFQRCSMLVLIPNSLANDCIGRPLSRHARTASALYSSLNLRFVFDMMPPIPDCPPFPRCPRNRGRLKESPLRSLARFAPLRELLLLPDGQSPVGQSAQAVVELC